MIDIDKARGMLVGLAVGDALGAPVEFQPPGTFAPVTGYRAGGAHRLPAGYWTDDTSMALCLADSLLACGGYDSIDVMHRYLRWRQDGYRSSTGTCFDIGVQTSAALSAFEQSPQVRGEAGRTDRAGNGTVMRLAPVVIAALAAGLDGGAADALYALSARDTHDSELAEAATQVFGRLLAAATQVRAPRELLQLGFPPGSLLAQVWQQVAAAVPDDGTHLSAGGFVVETLKVAVWAFVGTDTFGDAVLRAVNMGNDADTVGAVTGQLAGAFYGYAAIPQEWRTELFECEELVGVADQLAGMTAAPLLRSRFLPA